MSNKHSQYKSFMFSSDNSQDAYNIVLLRHGQSVGNFEGRLQGQSDFPLTEKGREQAHALADRWLGEGRSFDQIIASPLQRASQTANIIATALELPVEEDPIWMERNNGLLAGLSTEEAEVVAPRPPFFNVYTHIGRTGESQWQLYLRAGKSIDGILSRPPGKYLVVSHGGLLNMALYAILGIPPQANFHGPRFRFRNTAFADLLYRPNQHQWALQGLNDRSHWERTKENE